jgi:large conductance mechanosensitive channel
VIVEMKGFMEFIRQQGVVGLAVGFILGGAVSKVVTALVTDLINPLLGIILGVAGNLDSYILNIGKAHIYWGSFLATVIDFMVVAAVVYFGVKKLGLDKLDKPKA